MSRDDYFINLDEQRGEDITFQQEPIAIPVIDHPIIQKAESEKLIVTPYLDLVETPNTPPERVTEQI